MLYLANASRLAHEKLDVLHFSPPMHGTNPVAIQLANLLAQGYADYALKTLEARRPWTTCSPLHALLADALRPVKHRKATRPTRASKERRIQKKKQRAQVKKLRRPVRGDE